MRLTTQCSICHKPLQLVSETAFGNDYLRNYKCGHAFYERAEAAPLPIPDWETKNRRNYSACNGSTKAAFDFQKEGVEFIFKSNFNCLIADPMGLGKTIQSLLAAREAKFPDGSRRFKTILGVVKAATTYQWFGEGKEWFDAGLWSIFMIQGTKGFIPPGFGMYIISMDTLSRFMKTPAGTKILKDLNIDLVIVDECHSFKNPDSARSQALVAFLQDLSITEISRSLTLGCAACGHQWQKEIKLKVNCRTNKGTIADYQHGNCPECGALFGHSTQHTLTLEERTKGLILLSGTPIKNRAEEYFIPLNLMKPEVFTNLQSFRRNWLTQDPNTGKWNRIQHWRKEEFDKVIAPFIIRREKNAVLKDLPPFRREFERIEIDDPKFKESYNRALEVIQQRVDEAAARGKELSALDMQENLMMLRRIVGLSKVSHGLAFVEEFLESVENEKIAIGIHHEGVRDNLYFALRQKGIRVLKLSGEDSAERKNQILNEFNSNPEIRVLIINMIAGGVGLNIQSANNVLTLERQWNAADEEQFEGRFHRQGQTLPVCNTYLIAAGIPVEDYFTTMVEQKRKICGESLDGWDLSGDKAAMSDLMYRSLQTRLK